MTNISGYDEGSIHLCGFFSKNFFENFEANKVKFKPSELFSNISFDMLKKRNALDNYILKYYMKLDENNPHDAEIKRNMERYLKSFYKAFLKNPSEQIGSPFLMSPEIVDIYCPKTTQLGDNEVDLRKMVKEAYIETTKR